MAHCYSVSVNVNGKDMDICTLVPGNEELSKHVYEMEGRKGKPRKPTEDEINRSIDYYFKQHNDSQHPKIEEKKSENKVELDDMMELVE